MSWFNPALRAMKMPRGFTVKGWNPLDAKNTCNVCPCLWSSPQYYYNCHDQPCGMPLQAIAARSDYLLIISTGRYYELSGYFWPNPAPAPAQPSSPPLAAATLQAIVQVTPPGGTMAEFVFMEFPFTIDEIQIAKYVLGTPNVGDDQWIYETGWTSKCFFDVSDWLTLAGPDNPYPNGTYDDLFIDNTGVYNRYYPWVDAPLPPEGSLVYLTGMYVEEGFWTPGINQQWGNPNGVITDGTDAAGYARFSVPYVHTYGTNEPIGWPNPTLPASASHELRQQNQGVEGPAQTIPRLKNTGRPPG